MNDSNILDIHKILGNLEQRMYFFHSVLERKLDDLICKEQANQLWKEGVESSLRRICTKIDSQCVSVSVSCQTDEQFEQDRVNSQESKVNPTPPYENFPVLLHEEENCVLFCTAEDRQSNSQAEHVDVEVTCSSSSTQENASSSSSIVRDASQRKLLESPKNPRALKLRSYACIYCEAKFSQKDEMLIHEKSHLESTDPSLKCEACSRVFTNHSDLKRHYDSACRSPEGKLPFECVMCGKSYDTRDKLKKHTRYHKDKKHACTVCGKAFHMKHQVIAHMVNHTGEKPFPCNLCLKGFSTLSYLKYHVRVNHSK